MRKGFRHVVAAGAILALVGGPAAAGGSRQVVERPYRTPVPGAALGNDYQAYYYDCQNQIGCAIIPVPKNHRFVTLEVEDVTAQNVFFSVSTMPAGAHVGDYCGSTGDRISTNGARELLVRVVAGVCQDGETPSVVTTGVVRGTFFRRG